MNAFTRVTESNSRNCSEIVLFVILWNSSIDMVGQIYVYTISYVYIIVKKSLWLKWRRSGVFILNIEHISNTCSSDFVVNFVYVNTGWICID